MVGAGPAARRRRCRWRGAGAACCSSIARDFRATRSVATRSSPMRCAVCRGSASPTACGPSGTRSRPSRSTAPRASGSTSRASFVTMKREALDASLAADAVERAPCLGEPRGVARPGARAATTSRSRVDDVRPRGRVRRSTATGAQVDLLEPHGLVSRRAPAPWRCGATCDRPSGSTSWSSPTTDRSRPATPGSFRWAAAEYNVGCGRAGRRAAPRRDEPAPRLRHVRRELSAGPRVDGASDDRDEAAGRDAALRADRHAARGGPGPRAVGWRSHRCDVPVDRRGHRQGDGDGGAWPPTPSTVRSTADDAVEPLTGFAARLRTASCGSRYLGYEAAAALDHLAARRRLRAAAARGGAPSCSGRFRASSTKPSIPRTVFSVRGSRTIVVAAGRSWRGASCAAGSAIRAVTLAEAGVLRVPEIDSLRRRAAE